MKKFYWYLSVIFLFLNTPIVHSQGWQWAKAFGGDNNAYSNNVSTDLSGNVYISGGFTYPFLIVGNDTLIYTPLGQNGSNIFIAKLNATGGVIWAKGVAGNVRYWGSNTMCTDNNNNVYVAANCTGSSLSAGDSTFTNIGGNDILLVKYDSAGKFIWANNIPAADGDLIRCISTDGSNLYMTGFFESQSFNLGNGITLTNTWGNNSSPDVFIVKLNADGKAQWAKKSTGAPGGDMNEGLSNGISTDANGNSCLTGIINSHSFAIGNDSLNNTFGYYLAKFNTAGDLLWLKNAGMDSNSFTLVHIDKNGNNFVTGGFKLHMSVGDTTLMGSQNESATNIFLEKFNSDGNLIWVTNTQGTGNDGTQAINTDATGNCYITGYVYTTNLTLGNITIHNNLNGSPNGFAAKYTSMGDVVWAQELGSSSFSAGANIAVDETGASYMAGSYYGGQANFGNIILPGGQDQTAYLAKINAAVATPLEEPITRDMITVFPNPSSTGEFNFNGVKNDCRIEVFDIVGQLICHTLVKQASPIYKIHIPQQIKGIYFYKVIDNNSAVNEGKIIID